MINREELIRRARAVGLTGVSVLALAAALCAPAAAQSYPNKPIRMIVPWPVGGGTDITARKLADPLSAELGQPVIVDNRGGANGIIGTGAVARAAPDGYTIMVSTVTSHASNPSISKDLPYDTLKDFAPVTIVSSTPLVIVAHPSFRGETVSDIVRMAKAQPNAINYASFGSGSISHLAGELFNMMANIKMQHIPYKGGGPALTDVIGGQVPIYFSGVNSALPHIKAGRLRAVAVTGTARAKTLPDVPTVAETPGFRGYESTVPYGVWVPARTAAEIVAKLHSAIVKVVQAPQFSKSLENEGSDPVANTPKEMESIVVTEIDKLAKVISIAGIKEN